MNKKNEVKKIYPLTPMQEGMLYHTLLDNESSVYFEQSTVSTEGNWDIKHIKESFNKLIERYDIFRTVFAYEKVARPLQIVMKERSANVHFEDITHLSESSKNAFINEYKIKDRERSFDLRKDIPIRISVIKTDTAQYKLIWSSHHIIMDGWCMGIVMKEFLEIYQSLKENRAPNLGKVYPYSTYIKWLEEQNNEEASSYWKVSGEYPIRE